MEKERGGHECIPRKRIADISRSKSTGLNLLFRCWIGAWYHHFLIFYLKVKVKDELSKIVGGKRIENAKNMQQVKQKKKIRKSKGQFPTSTCCFFTTMIMKKRKSGCRQLHGIGLLGNNYIWLITIIPFLSWSGAVL